MPGHAKTKTPLPSILTEQRRLYRGLTNPRRRNWAGAPIGAKTRNISQADPIRVKPSRAGFGAKIPQGRIGKLEEIARSAMGIRRGDFIHFYEKNGAYYLRLISRNNPFHNRNEVTFKVTNPEFISALDYLTGKT